ncbi:MAG: DNA translocase FtsK 4TM domain-containing protein [SAR324 cluster bacterium]|nr:DNA translocase FtsK 4TM domain-containing protein [SAR324 cluster bacterium]
MKDFEIVAQTDQESNTIPYLKIYLGLVLLIALISYDRLDPSPLNLLWPSNDIGNWFGLPGALVSGFLNEIFGLCGFLVPMFLLVFSHKKTINRRQAFLLDTAIIMLLTIGLSQIIQTPVAELTGLLGAISNAKLENFPGELITILVISGFIVRYSIHYTPNLQFIVMMQHFWAILLLVSVKIGGIGKKLLRKIEVLLGKQFVPLATASKQKSKLVKLKLIQYRVDLTKKIVDFLLEIKPFHRLLLEKTGKTLTGPLTDEILNELAIRQLLKKTIEEFEKRNRLGNI